MLDSISRKLDRTPPPGRIKYGIAAVYTMGGSTGASFSPPDRALMIVNDIRVHGVTRMQKYGFLLAKQYNKEVERISKAEPSLAFYDDWEPLWFGPFSKTLAKDIDACVEHGLIHKEPVSTSPDSHRFSLTISGRKQWRAMFGRFNGEMTAMHGKVSHLQRVSLESLLEDIYNLYPEYTVKSIISDRVRGD